ncbi:4-hydroxy-tetrahydrodipicolinate reductase [Thermomicrobiaceae bacterium CFH 74404]|uniref:4-hydroxy-tetrahydrodipicolinate reductase n=1 Tax=Thermalbibacter longus TaxID=2951981 RepID=A0AA41WCH0_9BACT|nr:4-hydroxy-tetrahydrodipicolinate reductase [Thermalbibacter longus]MCM8747939.1 4-hydroxy-tetrahydrodipicolinate reductase [Thermalbibacter longus]
MLRLAIAGITGRMGREVAELALADPGIALTGGLIRPEREHASDLCLQGGIRITADAQSVLRESDVLIDFTQPSATAHYARACAEAGCALATGTTGLSEGHLEELRAASACVPVLHASNFSLGIAVVRALLPLLARALGDWDIEIIEHHHRHKRDAPSGTALALLEAIRAGQPETSSPVINGRQGIAPRRPGEIGMHAIRGGGEPGRHCVLFGSEDELLELSHRVHSRRAYAAGALAAAKWLAGRPPGWYVLDDLLAERLGHLA